ncbi:jg9185 [Pararge aegeria aegeria]|uniref:Jg9185 protein n=1 Tax=Pararge aegeria aegeria TaxID=348720 RepID=A0A8S4R0X6_9NEOP|nr:jg9185 [Pararge aegeria aegeria]
MPASKNDHVGKTAKLIYKNSRNTINTYSRTYSGASQMFTKSLILQLKQNLPNEDYYEENGTVKRDLSIETDICILRGYYKKRRNKFINRETISTKSKYSLNHTEIDTIDEFKYDGSACGDSEISVKLKNTNFNINLTSLVVQNLKKMLNDWVKIYLLDNKETKQKIESVLDSLLHKLEYQQKETVSSCTYTVDIELFKKRERKPQFVHSINSQAFRQRSFSVPLGGKCCRIFSTLSVPRNIYRKNKSKDLNKLNGIRHRKIVLSTNGSSKYLFTSSSLNFLTLPTKLMTKCCTMYQQDVFQKKKRRKQKTLVLPNELYDDKNVDSFRTIRHIDTLKNINISKTTNVRNSTLKTIPSIYKNMFNCFSRNDMNDSRNINQSTKNDCEQDISLPLVPTDIRNHSLELEQSNKYENGELKNYDQIVENFDKITKKPSRRKKKNFSRLVNRKNMKSKVISSPKRGDYVKLDIQVNVYPSNDYKNGKDAVKKCKYLNPPISTEATQASTDIIKDDSKPHHHIIPLLDGAVSEAKYMVSGEIFQNSSKNNNNVDNPVIDYIAKESQIAKEIGEIKVIIKALANTTEQLVNEHLKKTSFSKDVSKLRSIDRTKKCHDENLSKPSLGVQISSVYVKNEVICSGIKLKKDPKKKLTDYNPRLMKRSTSYSIIDSESIIKVTDMTSAAQGEINISI